MSIMRNTIINEVSKIKAKLQADVKELEDKAKELDLTFNYSGFEAMFSKRVNEEWIMFPRYGMSSARSYNDTIGEHIANLVIGTEQEVKDVTKRAFTLMKDNKVKVESYHYIHDLKCHLNRVTELNFPYMSEHDREGHSDFLIKMQGNGKGIYQFTEEQYNYIKNIIEG